MSTIRAIVQRRAGDPADVLEIADVDSPSAPGPGQVTVAVTMFSVHPGDLQMITTSGPGDGRPAGVGAEATGIVVTAGPGVTVSVGTRVSMFLLGGLWRERVTVSAADVVPVPDSLSDEVAAQLLINPITVLMLRRAAQRHVSVGFDGVILNNAAASSVGRLFTAGAAHHRIATISIVRSDARAEQLAQRFPDVPVVSTQSADWQQRVRDAAGGRPIAVALDPIGGDAAADLLSLLAPGGSVIVYGLMAPEPIPVHAATLVHRDLSISGLNIGRWAGDSAEQRRSDVASALAIAHGFAAHFDVAATYPLGDIRSAVAHAAQSGKTGTVLVRVTEGGAS